MSNEAQPEEEAEPEPVAIMAAAAVPSLIPFPGRLDLDGNISTNWKKFRRTWDNYEIAAGLLTKDKALRTATFLTCIGSEAMDVFDGFAFEQEDDKKDIDTVIRKFETFCIGKTNETFERYTFNMCNQMESETIDAYVSKLRKLAKTCNYDNLLESLIRDRIVCGIKDNNVRKRLLQEDKLTLEKSIDICRAMESTSEKLRTMTGAKGANEADDIKAVRSKFSSNMPKSVKPKKQSHANQNGSRRICKYCGMQCIKGQCPAFGKTCDKCGKYNHFASQCRQKHKYKNKGRRSNVRQFNTQFSDSDVSELEIMTVSHDVNTIKSKIFAKMLLIDERKEVKFQVDCGADTNLIPRSYVNESQIEKSENVLIMYNQSKLKAHGSCMLRLKNPKTHKRFKVKFIVVDDDFTPILGSKASQAMKLIKIQFQNIMVCESDKAPSDMSTIESIKTNYADVFEGEGTFQGKLKLEIDNSITPVKSPLRRIPIALKPKLKLELDRLQKINVITPVDTPTDWVSSLVIVKKASGKLRLCIDPKPLNKALKRSHYPLPVIEDLLPELSRAKVFSKCDVKNGFWHVTLDEDSSYLTTFETPFGRFRWTKMPFGISPAPEYFQLFLDREIENLPGVRTVADDIIIYGEGNTMDEAIIDHDRKLKALLDRCRERNIKINKDKFVLRATEMPYIGHLLTSNGVKPDPEKTNAILNMEKPTDVKAVQRLLGMCNYLTKFLANLSDICEPIRSLTRKENAWNWTFEHDKAFNELKQAVTEAPVLKYFDSKLETTLQCDASDKGLGATLMQNCHPIAYASRALTKTEQNYAQIEKELLAVLYGMEKFHQYTYGRKVTVESDHKPLETLYRKPLYHAPKRLQRMFLRLQRYDIELKYKPGQQMYIADTLSRAYLENSGSSDSSSKEEILQVRSDIETEIEQINMADYLVISDERKQLIANATRDDKTLQTLISIIETGWNEEPTDELSAYYNVRDELSVQNGIIFKGDRCVIPSEMRKEIMEQLHTHIGIDGCLKRARECVYWPRMNAELRDFIRKCDVCQAYSTKQQKESLKSHEVPSRPWAKVGTDLFALSGNDYLITVDYYSSYFEIDRLYDTSSKTVINKLKHHFSRWGIPETVISDNGPQFSSAEFKKFSAKYDFRHKTSSPGHAQSNGKVENAVKLAKRLMKKAKSSESDPFIALLNFRNTPQQSTKFSPIQQMINRRTRTLLPVKSNLLEPTVPQNVQKNLIESKKRQAKYYNRDARDLKPLAKGDTVRIEPKARNEKWEKGLVTYQKSDRSYEIEKENGNVVRRNRKYLRKTPETFEHKPEFNEPTMCPERADSDTTDNLPTEEPPDTVDSGSQPCSRYGRVIRKPSWMKDFDMK